MENLSLAALPDYDQGSIAVLFDQALRDIFLDLEDRPLLKSKRTLTLQLEFKPESDPTAHLESIVTDVMVKCALPNKAARTNYLRPNRKAGAIGFEPDTSRAQYAPDQTTIPFNEEETY